MLLHAALLVLIAFLLAPVDLGQGGERVLLMQLGTDQPEPETQDEPVSVSVSVPDEESVAEAPPTPEPPKVAISETASASHKPEAPIEDDGAAVGESPESNPTGSPAGSGTAGSASASEGASGSFFGISAEGHEFVYVLDRSTSMRGSRYQRAAAELIRSVSGLSEKQSFYVFLFSNKTVQLFGNRDEPRCVPATAANKERLREWLSKTAPDGNTDPREALFLALKIKPSAIFLLSDGEFTEDKPVQIANTPARSSLEMIGRISQRVTGSLAPIHTVAYEDPKSKVNLQRIAAATGGKFRFVKYQPRTNDHMLTEVRAALDNPPSLQRSGELDKLVFELTRPRVSKRPRTTLYKLLVSDSLRIAKHLDDLEDEVVRRRVLQLDRLTAMDPSLVPQDDLLDALLERWANDKNTAFLMALHGRLQTPASRAKASTLVGRALFEEAETLRKRGKISAAYAKYKTVVEKYSDAEVTASCAEHCLEAENSIVNRVQEMVDGGRVGDAVRFLRENVDRCTESRTKRMWREQLTDTLDALFAKADEASREGDDLECRLILKEVESGFESPSEMESHRQQFYQKESRANGLYRAALRVARAGNSNLARQQFATIVRLYPRSQAAAQARRYLPSEDEVASE